VGVNSRYWAASCRLSGIEPTSQPDLDSTGAWSDDPARCDLPAETGAHCAGWGQNSMRHILESTIARRNFIASLGGAAVVGLMSHEARADAPCYVAQGLVLEEPVRRLEVQVDDPRVEPPVA